MNKVRHIVMLALLLGLGFSAMSQIRIPGTTVSFQFPNGGWKYLKTMNPAKNTVVYLYSYSARTIVDKTGEEVTPFMRIYVKQNYSDSPFELAYERSVQQPFQSLEEYMEGLPGKDGIGYIGAYTGADDGKDYQFRMIYFRDGSNVVEIRMETSLDTYEEMDKEFDEVMKTVRTK